MRRWIYQVGVFAVPLVYVLGLGIGSLTPNNPTATFVWCGWFHPAWGLFVGCAAGIVGTALGAAYDALAPCKSCAKLTDELAFTREALLASDQPKRLR